MPAQKGSLMLLKVGNAGSPETFTTVGGMRVTKFILNSQIVDSSNKDSGAWRQLLADAGTRFISISGNGIFTDSASEETVRQISFSNQQRNFQITFGNGDSLSGAFIISSYERSGEYNGEENYAMTLESAGVITFTAA